MLVRLSLKTLLRRREFSLLFVLNLTLGLTGFVTLDAFRTLVQSEMNASSKALLTADLKVSSRRELQKEEWTVIQNELPPFEHTSTRQVFSMIQSTREQRLAAIRGLNPGFPFYGSIVIEPSASGRLPEQGTAWIAQELLHQMNVNVGDSLQIGKKSFRIGGVVRQDVVSFQFNTNLAPRVYVLESDLLQTDLIGFGTTQWISHHFKFQNDVDAEALAQKLQSHLKDPGLDIESHVEAAQSTGRMAQLVRDFLSLMSIGAMILTCFGMGILFQNHLLQQSSDLGLLQTLGVTQRQALIFPLVQILILSLAGTIFSLGFGALLLPTITHLLRSFVPLEVSIGLTTSTMINACALSLIQSLGVCLPLVRKWSGQSTAQVFHEGTALLTGTERLAGIWYLPLALMYWILSCYQVKSIKTGSLFFLSFAGALVVLMILGSLGLKLLKRNPVSSGNGRLVISALIRNYWLSLSSFLAISLGSMLVSLVGQLQMTFQKDLQPEDTSLQPSFFMFDIQDEQLEGIKSFAAQRNLNLIEPSPMIRARLTAMNDQANYSANEPVLTREQEQEQRFRNRDYNLSYRLHLSDSEKIVQGKPIQPQAQGDLWEISVEERLAQRLKLELGDRMTFEVLDTPVVGVITNLRRVRWTSFQPNFFIQFPPAALEDAPKTWVAALSPMSDLEKQTFQSEFVKLFTNISLVDVSAVVGKVLAMIRQMSQALYAVGFLTLICAMAVLFSAFRHQLVTRASEFFLLSALGQTRNQIKRLVILENVFKALAGVSAGCTISVFLSWALCRYSFYLEYVFDLRSIAAISASVFGLTILITLLGTLRLKLRF